MGVDQSPAMLKLARKIAPRARYEQASFLDVKLPACVAITAIGEVVNYRLEGAHSSAAALRRFFVRAYKALAPGGVLIFDCATPARLPKAGPRIHWREEKNWAIASISTNEDGVLRRRSSYFRRSGRVYRRGEEVHDLQLYEPRELLAELTECGFQPQHLRRRGQFPEIHGMAWMLAVKPK
jgi:SAM-dependent methyltransferase